MFAIASLSNGKNGVRSHIVKYKKGIQPMFQGSKIAQVDTNTYRRLHRLWNNGDGNEVMNTFNAMEFEYVIDVDALTIHKKGCDKVGEKSIPACIKDMSTAGLKMCDCLS